MTPPANSPRTFLQPWRPAPSGNLWRKLQLVPNAQAEACAAGPADLPLGAAFRVQRKEWIPPILSTCFCLPCASGSAPRSASRRRRSAQVGRSSPPARIRSSWRRPAPARRWPRSSPVSITSGVRNPCRAASTFSTSRRSKRSTTTSIATCRCPSKASPKPRNAWAGTLPVLEAAVRTGDTPTAERQRLIRQPPHVLITTPESLHLLLTSRARETLRGVTHCHRR